MATQNSPNGHEKPKLLPKFNYYLDESDPDVIVLRREDGTLVGAFSAGGQPGRASSRPPRKTTATSSGSMGLPKADSL